MFIPNQMQKINIFVREEDVERLVVALARLEVLDLTETEERGWFGEAREQWAELAETYTNQERRLQHLLETLDIPAEKRPSPKQMEPRHDASAIKESLQEVEQAVQDWEQRKGDTKDSIERVSLLLQELRLLEPLDVSMAKIRQLEYVHLVVGTIPHESLENLEVVLFRIPFVLISLQHNDERRLIIAATDCEHAAILDRALRSFFLDPFNLPKGFSDKPREASQELEQHLEKAKAQQAELEQEKEVLIKRWRRRLLTLWRQAHSNAVVTRTITRLGRHEEVYLLTGWIPQTATDEVVATVEEVTEGRSDVGMVEPVPGGRFQVPTRLQNPAFLRPFETITATFGFPAYDELDPTPLVALTFVLMYGMMFGDVGHGVLLALAALWLRRRGGQLASISTILLISAISAIGFGFLYGSLFGREDILPHLWLSPLGSIGNILIVSVAAGIVLLNIGFLLNLISAMRSKNWGQLLFSPNGLAGIWFYWALLGSAFVLWRGASLSLNRWLGLILVPVLLIFLQEPLSRLLSGERPLLEEGWGEYSVESFFELFETLISDVSNSLSFVRLGAFAVAHAGLSQIVLSIADILGSGPGRWLVLVIGTVIIVVFEGLIVGIQALRLEYYEFFGKFFSGRGRAFGPLRLSKTEQA